MERHSVNLWIALIGIFSLLCVLGQGTLVYLLASTNEKGGDMDVGLISTYVLAMTTILGIYTTFMKSIPKTKKSDPLYISTTPTNTPPPSPENRGDFV